MGIPKRMTVFQAKELLYKRHGFYLTMWSLKMWNKAIVSLMVDSALGKKV